MSLADTAVLISTILSGLVSLLLILSGLVDFFTRGWVRQLFRRWLLDGLAADLDARLRGLQEDHHKTQVFLVDLGLSHNELIEAVCEEHEIEGPERPEKLDTDLYQLLMEQGDGGFEPGDFKRDD